MGEQRKHNNKGSGIERYLFEKPPLTQNQPRPKVIAHPVMLERVAFDGFSNPMAYLGEASPLMSSVTFERSDLTRYREMLTTLYRDHSIAKKIIDMRSEDMTREWYTLSSAQVSEEDLCRLRELEAKHSIKQEITNALRRKVLYRKRE